MPTDPPRRRVELRLDVTADDLTEALAKIEALCAVVLERESAHMTRARESHSYGSAGDYRIVVRPDAPTGDDYRAALLAWADEQT